MKGAVTGENGSDDVDHSFVLPDAGGAGLAEEPQPWHQTDAITGQATFTAQHRSLAGKRGAGTIAQPA